MPWNNSGMASGAASGAAAGSAFGPWGTAIGGVAGGVMGGLSGGDKMPDVPTLPASRYPGAVSTPYGSMIYDPVTGGTKFIQNSMQGGYTPSSYQDAALYDALLGGNSNTTSSGLTNQIQSAQLMLNQLKAKGAGNQPKYEDFGVVVDPNTGKPINYQDYINKRGTANPLWDIFMQSTGGSYGSDNPDISFGKWAKDWTAKSLNPAIGAYENATKSYMGNKSAADDAIAQQELQLKQMQGLAGDQGQAQAGLSQNPLLAALQRQEAEANDPSYLKVMNAQAQDSYDNQLRGSEQALAARGLGASGLGEMTRARMGLQLGNTFNQNALAANQMATDKRQSALNNRMNMLNFLSGRKDTGFNQGMQQQQLGLSQMGLGSQVGTNQMNQQSQRDVAQAGLQSQYGLAQWNQNNANQMGTQRNWASALGGLGYGIGSGGYGNGSPAAYTNSGISMQDWGATQTQPSTIRDNSLDSWNSWEPRR